MSLSKPNKNKSKPRSKLKKGTNQIKKSIEKIVIKKSSKFKTSKPIKSLESIKSDSRRQSFNKLLEEVKLALERNGAASKTKSESVKCQNPEESPKLQEDENERSLTFSSDIESGPKSLDEYIASFAAQTMTVEKQENNNNPDHQRHHQHSSYVLYYQVSGQKNNTINRYHRPVGVFESGQIGWTPEKPLPEQSRLNSGKLDIRVCHQKDTKEDYKKVRLYNARIKTINLLTFKTGNGQSQFGTNQNDEQRRSGSYLW